MSESYGPITEYMRLEKLHSRGDLIHPASLDLNKANWKVSSSEDLVQNNFLKFSQRTAEGASRSKLQQVSTPQEYKKEVEQKNSARNLPH